MLLLKRVNGMLLLQEWMVHHCYKSRWKVTEMLQGWGVCHCYKNGHHVAVTRTGGMLLFQTWALFDCYKSEWYITIKRMCGMFLLQE